jgi:hypothetical protein
MQMLGIIFGAIRNFFWPMSQPQAVCNALDWVCRDGSGVLRVWAPDAVEPVLNFVVENSTPANAVALAIGIGATAYFGYTYHSSIGSYKHAPQTKPTKTAQETANIEPPPYFMCPINLEIMTDPMITPTGHTFQRSEIERHLRNNRFDPIDRSPCTLQQLAPNLALRDTIEAWLDAHPDYEREAGVVRRNKT